VQRQPQPLLGSGCLGVGGAGGGAGHGAARQGGEGPARVALLGRAEA
jgi:hypothetical protein